MNNPPDTTTLTPPSVSAPAPVLSPAPALPATPTPPATSAEAGAPMPSVAPRCSESATSSAPSPTTSTPGAAPSPTATTGPTAPSTPPPPGWRATPGPSWSRAAWRKAAGSETTLAETECYHYPARDLRTAEALRGSTRVALLSEDGQACWYAGSLALALGGGGIGKSRWAVGLAIASITGREFCGFQTAQVGRWLILNAENDEFRTRDDLLGFAAGYALSPEERERVSDQLKIIAGGADSPMPPTDLGDPVVERSLRRLAAELKPAVVVIDPWESFIAHGDVNDAAVTRQSLTTLQTIFPSATLLVLHHSREGKEATRGAFGFNSTAFSKGSKTVMTRARFVINITALHSNLEPGEDPGLVIGCGKANDTAKFPVRCAILGADNVYRVDPSFDVKAYLDSLEEEGEAKPALTVEDVAALVRDGITAGPRLVELCQQRHKVSRPTVHLVLADAVKRGRLTRQRRGTADHYAMAGTGVSGADEGEAEAGADGGEA